MVAGDINQVTISGHIDYQPRLSSDDDGQAVCEFLLSHVSASPDNEHWDLQHYSVAIHGPQARVFVDTYQPGDMLIITGRLDCQDHLIPHWLWRRLGHARHHRPHDHARIGHRTYISEPLASITADTITTSHSPAPQTSSSDPLPAR